jgi:hypothetical protein
VRLPGAATGARAALAVPEDIARDAAAIVGAALTEPERAMLEFERSWWQRGGAKEQAIRDTFGLTPTRYYQSLNSLLASPAALRYDPALVHRLLRLRGEATRGRRLA